MMKSYTLAVLCAVLVLGGGSGVGGHTSEKLLSRRARMVEGSAASIEDVPWQVDLMYEWGSSAVSFCGGSIISSNWVVTAVSCVSSVLTERRTITFISAGATDYREGSRHTIIGITRHPLYEERQEKIKVAVHDIALVQVIEPFRFDRTRQPIPLYDRAHAVLAQSQATTSGWETINDFDSSFKLQIAAMKLTTVQKCKDYLSLIYSSSSVPTGQICAESLSGTACAGRTGRSLTVNGTLVGIFLWKDGNLCTNDSPSVFTEVARYRYWISEMTSV